MNPVRLRRCLQPARDVHSGRFSLGWVGKLTPEQLGLVGLLLKLGKLSSKEISFEDAMKELKGRGAKT